MNNNDWIYYNHGLISARLPHEENNISDIEKNKEWQKKNTFLLDGLLILIVDMKQNGGIV